MVIYHPAWSFSCNWCAKYAHKDGIQTRMPDGREVYRGDAPTPCQKCPKPPAWAKGAGYEYTALRAMAAELTDQQRQALDHYRECKGVGWNTPAAADPIVRWFARIVREVEDQYIRDKAEIPGQVLKVFLELASRWRMLP